jgi:hypothetical protein
MRGARGGLAGAAFGIRARDVEITQRGIVHRMREGGVGKHDLGHQLGAAIGVDRLLGRILRDRDHLGNTVSRGGGGEDEVRYAAGHRAFDQRAAGDGVVAVIFERIGDRFGYDDRSREMHDRVDGVIGKSLANQRIVVDRTLNERRAGIDRPAEAGGEIVDHHDVPPGIERRQHRVAADIARPARHQHRPHSHNPPSRVVALPCHSYLRRANEE